MKTNFKTIESLTNKVYYLPLNDYSTFWDNITTNDNNEMIINNNEKILFTDIVEYNHTNYFKIVTNKKVSNGYRNVIVKKVYENKSYNNYIDFINNTYVSLTIGIINKMYSGFKLKKDGSYTPSSNYDSVKQIVQKGYRDNLIDDLKQVCYMTLFYNLKDSNYDSYDFKNIMLSNKPDLYIFDNNSNDFIQDNKHEINLYIACFRAISRCLYNNKSKHDKINVMSLYDNDSDSDNTYKIDSYAMKQAVMNYGYNKIVIDNVNTICKNVLEYIKAMEKPFIYNKCYKVMVELQKGLTQKDIAKNLGISRQSVSKYQNIICCAYNTINKSYVDNSSYKVWLNNYHDTMIDFKDNKIKISFENVSFNNMYNDYIMDKSNSYYHDKKQAIYNVLFNAYNPIKVQSRINNDIYMYRKELQIDTQF